MAGRIDPRTIVLGLLVALALSAFLGHEAWAQEGPSIQQEPSIETMPGYGLNDYEFMEKCYAEFLTLMKQHASKFEGVHPDEIRGVLSRAVDECANQLERYRTDEAAYHDSLVPDNLREYVGNYRM